MKPPKRHPLSEQANNYLLYQCFFQGFKSISFIKLYHNIKTKHTISSLQIIINFKVISIYQIQNIQFHYFSNFIDGKFTNQYQFLSYIIISKTEYTITLLFQFHRNEQDYTDRHYIITITYPDS